jgi:alanyl-tRNA synthetase
LGKSLRKKGFDPAALLDDPDAVAARVAARVHGWIEADARVAIDADGPGLTDLRHWCCTVPQGTYRIACGGTHVTALRELGEVHVRYEQPEPGSFVAHTTVVPPA